VALWASQQQEQRPGVAECKFSRSRNIHDHYRIIEKPIGSGGFGVVSAASLACKIHEPGAG
jgi:hypothetical protein